MLGTMPSKKYHIVRLYSYELTYNGTASNKYTNKSKKVFTTSLPQNLANFNALVSN